MHSRTVFFASPPSSVSLSRAGDDYMTKKLGFLAVAFRDFDVSKSNMLHLEEFRRALSCNHQFLPADQVDKCFEVCIYMYIYVCIYIYV